MIKRPDLEAKAKAKLLADPEVADADVEVHEEIGALHDSEDALRMWVDALIRVNVPMHEIKFTIRGPKED